MSLMIEKLTELLIKQDMKDRIIGQKELISKVEAYKGLIKFLKEIEKYEENNSYSVDAIDSMSYYTSKNIH